MRFSSGRKRLAGSALVLIVNLRPLSNSHPADEPDPLRCEFASPSLRRRAIRMRLSDPASGFQEKMVGSLATILLDGAGPIPALDPFHPHRIYAVSCISESSVSVLPFERLVDHGEGAPMHGRGP